jgi:uracil-DNA glycosylase family 4
MSLEKLKALKKQYNNCDRCLLHTCRSKIVFATGQPQADIMVILEKPSDKDTEVGQHLSRYADNQVMRFLAEAAHINLGSLHFASIVMCPTPDDREFTHNEAMACRDRLVEQIYHVTPYMIFAFGKKVMSKLYGVKSKNGLVRGTIYEIPFSYNDLAFVVPVMMTNSLGSVIKNPDVTPGGNFDTTVKDLKEVKQIIETYKGISHA